MRSIYWLPQLWARVSHFWQAGAVPTRIAPRARRLSTELALVPLAFALHNLEEALSLGTHLPLLRDMVGAWAGADVVLLNERQYLSGLAAATLASFTLLAVAWRWDRASAGLVVLQVAMLLNVLSHVTVAAAAGGYVPGLWTALLIQAPMSAAVLRHVRRAGWLSPAAWRQVATAAVLLHGPGLWLFLAGLRWA